MAQSTANKACDKAADSKEEAQQGKERSAGIMQQIGEQVMNMAQGAIDRVKNTLGINETTRVKKWHDPEELCLHLRPWNPIPDNSAFSPLLPSLSCGFFSLYVPDPPSLYSVKTGNCSDRFCFLLDSLDMIHFCCLLLVHRFLLCFGLMCVVPLLPFISLSSVFMA
ncbi:hypothetical protein C3L33_06309, partial [Rhododendron williamsianum]